MLFVLHNLRNSICQFTRYYFLLQAQETKHKCGLMHVYHQINDLEVSEGPTLTKGCCY